MKRGEVKVRTYGCIAIVTAGQLRVTVKAEDRTLTCCSTPFTRKRAAGIQFVSWRATKIAGVTDRGNRQPVQP